MSALRQVCCMCNELTGYEHYIKMYKGLKIYFCSIECVIEDKRTPEEDVEGVPC